jgi:hypothetical protein
MAEQMIPNTQNAEAAATMAEDTMQQVRTAAVDAGEQVWSTAQDLAQKAREQTTVATDMLYQQGTAASEYLVRNVNAYPLTALFLAGVLGYGMAYLVHRNWQGDEA